MRVGCPKTSVRNYQYSLRNNPEEGSSHLLRGRSLQSNVPVRKFRNRRERQRLRVFYTRSVRTDKRHKETGENYINKTFIISTRL
jgi:hypothetical protein